MIVKLIFATLFSLLFLLSPTLQAADLGWSSKSVVKLFVTTQAWQVHQPWSKSRSRQGTCSGFFIEQGILTNAHCVADATYIELEIPGMADKVEAKAIAINHQIDLALLKLTDQTQKPDISPIKFGSLPGLREKVVTVGYPQGGRQVSYTEGVVSRIDVMRYSHSNVVAPLVQTDASINPGNSGGPVFSDKKGTCLGVSTQKSNSGEGQGYFIPTPIIKQFLLDVKDGTIQGIPSLSAYFQTLENPASRKQHKLTDKQSGIRIRDTAKNGSLDGVLKRDDVLLEIDGHNILNDGRVPFQDSGRIWLGYFVAQKQVGDNLKLKISREGKVKTINLKLKPLRLALIPRQPLYDQQPSYYVAGGLLFLAIEQRYLWSWGRNWLDKIPTGLKSHLNTIYGQDGLEELIVISEIFDASINKGYSGDIENIRVTEVNGKTIKRLSDLKQAFESNKNTFHLLELDGNIQVVLNRKQAEAEDSIIRRRYGIR